MQRITECSASVITSTITVRVKTLFFTCLSM